MAKNNSKEKEVLIGVLKNKRDLNILLTENCYRIPLASAPIKQFRYLAFYQPAIFGRQGKCVRYYAKVLNHQIIKRKYLLPEELNYLRVDDYYLYFRVGKIRELFKPIRNTAQRRISFGFTTLNRLLKSKNILQLYDIAPTEQIIGNSLKKAGIKVTPQYNVLIGQKRYRLDFALFCRHGMIAIECDNKKAHSGPCQREKDRIKNIKLKQCGWTVIRLSENSIVSDLKKCVLKIEKTIKKLGGLRISGQEQ